MGLKKFRKGLELEPPFFKKLFFNIKWMSWNRPNVLLCGTLQKWRNVEGCLEQLAGVKAARVLITAGWVSDFCVCVYIYLYIYINIYIYKGAFCVMAFFSCCCVHISHCKIIFHLSFCWPGYYYFFSETGKKPRTSVSPSNMLHICALCSWSSKFS